MAVRTARFLAVMAAAAGALSCAEDGAPGVAAIGRSQGAAGNYITPVTCPPPNPTSDPLQVTCTDAAMTSNVLGGYFLVSGEARKQVEVAQTFMVGRAGTPGKLRTKLSRLFDPPAGTTPSLTIEFRTLIGGSIDISSGTTTTFATADIPAANLPLGANIATEYMVNMTSGFGGNGYMMQPSTTYAMVFRVQSPGILSIGVAAHEDSLQYPNGTGLLRQMRLVTATTFSVTPFVPDKRDINFALGLDDGCINGKILNCGVGECYNTTPQCTNGIINTCVPLNPTLEKCDLKDNDCDGRTDEIGDNATDVATSSNGFPPLGQTTCGVGACQRTYDNCTAGVTLPACVVGPKAVETCNSIDDDCDGRTDEIDDNAGDVSTVGNGYPPLGYNSCGNGKCAVRMAKCVSGVPVACVANSAAASVENCNGIDDDCDGKVDNRDVAGNKLQQGFYTGAAATQGVLMCQDGLQTCNAAVVACAPPATGNWNAAASCAAGAAVWSTTTVDTTPAAETCNGYDDNCDGVFDATGGALTQVFGLNTGSAYQPTASLGNATNALQYTPTSTVTLSRVEFFTGRPARTVPAPASVPTFAQTSISIRANNAGTPGSVLASGRVIVQEAVRWYGADLGTNITLVAGTTYWITWAPPNGVLFPYDPTPGAPMINYRISDDGGSTWRATGYANPWKFRLMNATAAKIRQACWPSFPTFPSAQRGVGICKDGTQGCNSAFEANVSSWDSCVSFTAPTNETCNGLDDDCNGTVDFPAGTNTYTCGSGRCLRQADNCTTTLNSPAGCGSTTPCAFSQNACPSATGTLGQGTVTGNTANAVAETCNGVDDDCNGSIDKTVGGATLTQTCWSNLTAAQGAGFSTAMRNTGRCVDGTQACNASTVTLTPTGTSAQPTQVATAAASWGVCSDIAPVAETCNNIDDNCDGTIDNPSTAICPLTANVTATNCVAAACQITACANGWFNTDGNYANGCETNDDTSVTGATCPGTQTAFGSVPLNTVKAWTGLLPNSANSDWFSATIVPTAGAEKLGRAGTVTVNLPTNPGGNFKVQVFASSCGSTWGVCSTTLGAGAGDTWAFNDTCAGVSTATDDCRGPAGTTGYPAEARTHAFPTTLIIRVYRVSTSAGSAAQYTVNVRYQ